MITSRLTSKAQTTIPGPGARRFAPETGDQLAYHIEDGRVIPSKEERGPIEDPFGSFDEWVSEADREAYGKL